MYFARRFDFAPVRISSHLGDSVSAIKTDPSTPASVNVSPIGTPESEIGDSECRVCGCPCTYKNYGVICCNACAAFFRRTIKESRSYVCCRGKRCRVRVRSQKRTCRYCRFRRCVDAGMNIAAVLNRQTDAEAELPTTSQHKFDTEDQFTKRILESFNATFVNRFDARIAAGSEMKAEATVNSLLESLPTEFRVLSRYLRHSGIDQLLNGEDELAEIATCAHYSWFLVHSCWATSSNNGHRYGQLHFPDSTFITVSDPIAPNSESSNNFVERSIAELHQSLVEMCGVFREAAIDAHDYAFICQLLVLQLATKIFPRNDAIRLHIDRVLLALRNDCSQRNRDFVRQIANLVTLVGEAQSWARLLAEFLVILTLNGSAKTSELSDPR